MRNDNGEIKIYYIWGITIALSACLFIILLKSSNNIINNIEDFVYLSIIFLVGFFSIAIFIKDLKKTDNESKTILLKDIELSNLINIVNVNIASAIIDLNGNFSHVTNQFLDLYEYERDEIIGRHYTTISEKKTRNISFIKNILRNVESDIEILTKSKYGKDIWIKLKIFPEFSNGKVIHYRTIFHNITNDKALTYMKDYDYLTGLMNNESFVKNLNNEIEKKPLNKIYILFIDLDDFKIPNDKYGYDVGDIILKTLSKRIKKDLKPSFFSRRNSDEFMMFLNLNNKKEVEEYLDKLKNIISIPLLMRDNSNLVLTTSIGISVYPDNGENAEELIQNANAAMSFSKEFGGNNHTFFNNNIKESIARKIRLNDILLNKIDNREFYNLYQAKYDISTKEIIGAEALIRMDGNEFYPNEFIPVAEKMGRISDITKIVIDNLIKDLNNITTISPNWYGLKDSFKISINLSSKDLKDEVIFNYIIDNFNKNNIDIKHIALEITEHTLMDNMNVAISILKKCQDLGMEISIDDFGTGYSSMNYLKSLPIDVVKIDKIFVDNITDKGNKDLHIIEAIIKLSEALNLKVIIEGIETKEQEELLSSIGCNYGQGYVFSRPIPFESFKNLMKGKEF